jgi:putative ABC transport system substrate-binding protein
VIDRRRFAGLVSFALLAGGSRIARAASNQPPAKSSRIGFINVGPAGPNSPNVAAFREGMRELGYVDGRNLTIDFFWADQRVERLPKLIGESLALRPDVIVSGGGPPTIRAVKAAVSGVPVVFITGDPISEGIVTSLSHPGGNLTGFAVLVGNYEGKRLELLREALPGVRRVAIIWNPAAADSQVGRGDAAAAASKLGMTPVWYEARNRNELEQALASARAGKLDALLVVADPVLGFERKLVVEFARQNRLPGVYFWREFVQDGGLMSYGASLTAIYRRAANYVDKILKGAKPADLPIEQPTTFELVINLGTAKELGIDIPKSLLVRADIIQ